MTLAEEYEHQKNWRSWETYLDKLSITPVDTIIDLGCGTGEVTKLLARRCLSITGIDNKEELLDKVEEGHQFDNINLLNIDLRDLTQAKLPIADGIWCSFTAAYFPNLNPVLASWLRLIRPGGWIALVEIDDLFGHQPLSNKATTLFRDHYRRLLDNNSYDFKMGSKLKDYLLSMGLIIILEQNMQDAELSFNGPASYQVLKSWEARLDRMTGLQRVLGTGEFQQLKTEFLACLANKKHLSSAIVKFTVARKPCSVSPT